MAKNSASFNLKPTKKHSPEWLLWTGVGLFFTVVIGLLVWVGSKNWVPFGKDFTLIDGVLRVRSAYNVLWFIIMVCSGCKAAWLAIVGFSRLKAWTLNNYLAAVFTVFFMVVWVGFIPAMAHADLSLKCASSHVVMKQANDCVGETKYVFLDYHCLKAIELRTHPTKPTRDVVVHLVHSAACECCIKVSSEHSKWQKKVKTPLLYLDYEYFPFDAGVFAYAIATGKIDMSKQGLTEGLFYANP